METDRYGVAVDAPPESVMLCIALALPVLLVVGVAVWCVRCGAAVVEELCKRSRP